MRLEDEQKPIVAPLSFTTRLNPHEIADLFQRAANAVLMLVYGRESKTFRKRDAPEREAEREYFSHIHTHTQVVPK